MLGEYPHKRIRMSILTKGWRWVPSQNGEDEYPHERVRVGILTKGWGWVSSQKGENRNPFKRVRMDTLTKRWGWITYIKKAPSCFCEDEKPRMENWPSYFCEGNSYTKFGKRLRWIGNGKSMITLSSKVRLS